MLPLQNRQNVQLQFIIFFYFSMTHSKKKNLVWPVINPYVETLLLQQLERYLNHSQGSGFEKYRSLLLCFMLGVLV